MPTLNAVVSLGLPGSWFPDSRFSSRTTGPNCWTRLTGVSVASLFRPYSDLIWCLRGKHQRASKMRRCLPSCRLSSRRATDDDGAGEASEVNEKRVRSPRDWSAIFLTAIRLFQVAYFGLVYLSLRGFQRSRYFRDNGPWQHSPDQMHHSRRMMRWARMQVRSDHRV
jgi:hypothetical protein